MSPKVYGHRYISTAIFYLLQSYYGCHGNIIMLPWWMATIKMVYKSVQSDAHIIPIVKNNYKYYLWLIVVAMATIVVNYT